MSGVKNKYEDDYQNGFTSGSSLIVCEKHFNDEDILEYIKKKGDPTLICSFCDDEDSGDEIENINKIPWDGLMSRIMPSIHYFYDDPANGISYDSSEGGYLWETYNSLELLRDVICLDADPEVIEQISESMMQDIWTEGEFYGDSYTDHLVYTWERFSNLVKYEVRFLFYEIEKAYYGENRGEKPYLILNNIGDFISKLGLIVTFPEKTNLFNQKIEFIRARQHNVTETVCVCSDIGTAPPEYASANRFSAEGISIFYGAEDEMTAINEVINKDRSDEYISTGLFFPSKDINLIDLRNLASIGFFNTERVHLIEASRFLQEFVKNISKKLEKNGKERIDYIPSQIVTEYLRHVLPRKIGKEIHGIIYKSIQNAGKDCYAIFANRNQCNDEGMESNDTVLILKRNSIKKIKVSEVK